MSKCPACGSLNITFATTERPTVPSVYVGDWVCQDCGKLFEWGWKYGRDNKMGFWKWLIKGKWLPGTYASEATLGGLIFIVLGLVGGLLGIRWWICFTILGFIIFLLSMLHANYREFHKGE